MGSNLANIPQKMPSTSLSFIPERSFTTATIRSVPCGSWPSWRRKTSLTKRFDRFRTTAEPRFLRRLTPKRVFVGTSLQEKKNWRYSPPTFLPFARISRNSRVFLMRWPGARLKILPLSLAQGQSFPSLCSSPIDELAARGGAHSR